MENKHNLSKQKTENHIKKFKNKTISAEGDLRDGLDKGDKNFTDHTSTEADNNYGTKAAKHTHVGEPKYVTTSKTAPSNSKLNGETFLSDLKKGDKKFTDETATDNDTKYGTKHAGNKGTKPPTKDHNLSTAIGKTKNMTTSPSIKGKGTPSNSKLDAEDFLSDNLTHIMGFNRFINEEYEIDENDIEDEEDSTEIE